MTYPTRAWCEERLKSVEQILNTLYAETNNLNKVVDVHESEKKVLESLLKEKLVR